jgi:hypothetical protein
MHLVLPIFGSPLSHRVVERSKSDQTRSLRLLQSLRILSLDRETERPFNSFQSLRVLSLRRESTLARNVGVYKALVCKNLSGAAVAGTQAGVERVLIPNGLGVMRGAFFVAV